LRVPLAIGVVVVLGSSGCAESPRSPVAASEVQPAPPPVVPVIAALNGIVYEVNADSRRPLASVGLDISIEYQSWPPSTFTDSNGRFTRANVGPGLKIAATKSGYSQPCRVQVRTPTELHEVFLVANELLSSTGIPPGMPITGPVMDGRVFERTAAGERPVSGVSITLDFTGGMGWAPSATTVSDATGRYLLCNVEDSTGLGLAVLVTKEGYGDVFTGVTRLSAFDIELRRR
jgi:hypothetical protein